MDLKANNRTVSKRRALKNYKGMIGSINKVLIGRLGKDLAAEVEKTTREEFEALIPEIPYIGGRKNYFSDMPAKAAVILGLYRSLEKKGVALIDFGGLLEEITTVYMNRLPASTRKLAGRLWMSALFKRQLRKQARASRSSIYEYDFVYDIVPGGEDYKWGIDYVECGIVKFFKRQGEEELAKYACILDYLMFPAIGVELVRTGNIAEGCRRCDFRFK
jgi:hypothetical protein